MAELLGPRPLYLGSPERCGTDIGAKQVAPRWCGVGHVQRWRQEDQCCVAMALCVLMESGGGGATELI